MGIAIRLQEVRERIAQAEARAGRIPGSVQLLAVTKTFPAAAAQEAYDAGQRHFGENRLQEALEKIPQLPKDVAWHLIGPLQRNKVRKALEADVALIEAVDSLRTAESISRIAGELGKTADVLLEVNIDGEASKHGFSPADLRIEWEQLAVLPHMEIRGLMCIPAPVDDVQRARPAFAALRQLAEELRARGPLLLPVLSMGMSHDFEVPRRCAWDLLFSERVFILLTLHERRFQRVQQSGLRWRSSHARYRACCVLLRQFRP